MAYVLVLLVVIIIALMIYNIIIYKRIQNFNNINQKITGLNVLQDFMNTIGEYSSVDEKIKKINDILIEKYDIKYDKLILTDKYQKWPVCKEYKIDIMIEDSI